MRSRYSSEEPADFTEILVQLDEPQQMAPGIAPDDRVVLFDGVCRLCGAWARFLIRFDRDHRFKLASVQSPQGQEILLWFGLPTDEYETMLLVEGPRMYTKSSAFIRVMARLPFPWKIFAVAWFVLSPLRNWLYDRIALNRYALFGSFDVCMMPSPDRESRFLSSGTG